jgi:hypothetical protein
LNFHIKLLDEEYFSPESPLKHLLLTGMLEDTYHIKNMFGLRLLSELGLFPLHFQFCRVAVNGNSLGAYILMASPQRALRRLVPGTVAVYRRKNSNTYRPDWLAQVSNVGHSMRTFQLLARTKDKQNIASALEEVIDLDAYLHWTEFNAIVLNSDTLDELFWYEVRTDKHKPARLQPFGWDFDAIFLLNRRPGGVEHPLFHTALDTLDNQIVNNPDIMDRYRVILAELLQGPLHIQHLLDTLQAVTQERNAIDDGRPLAIQDEARLERNNYSALAAELLKRQHIKLVSALQ